MSFIITVKTNLWGSSGSPGPVLISIRYTGDQSEVTRSQPEGRAANVAQSWDLDTTQTPRQALAQIPMLAETIVSAGSHGGNSGVYCVCYLFHSCNKVRGRGNSRKEALSLGHRLRNSLCHGRADRVS